MVSLASLFTLQLRAADRQVLLLDPAAGSTAAKPALAPGHEQGWTRCGTAAPSPAQEQPHSAHITGSPQDQHHLHQKMCSSALQRANPGAILFSFGEIMVLTI